MLEILIIKEMGIVKGSSIEKYKFSKFRYIHIFLDNIS